MKLVQVRPCDGKCCEESPRFPDRRYKKKKKCRYFKLEGPHHCQIQSGKRKCPSGESPVWPGRSAKEVFQETCVEWPHNSPEGRGTGGCCWQWIDGD